MTNCIKQVINKDLQWYGTNFYELDILSETSAHTYSLFS